MTMSFLKSLNEDFISQRLTKSDFEFMCCRYAEKRDKIDKVMKLTEMLAQRVDDESEIFDWLEQYKPFFSFDSITRPLLAYLIGRITVGLNKEVCVEFLHEKEFQFLTSAMEKCKLI